MKKNLLIAIISLSVIFTVNAIPQNGRQRRPNQNVNNNENFDYTNIDASNVNNNANPNDDLQNTSESQLIADIFDPPSSRPTRPPNNRGAGVVVTPDPTFTPTTSPQMFTINQQNCTCVPYHMCDPKTNTVKTAESDDEVIGYGVIDIRFDPYDCQDVLDVCCIGPATFGEQPAPVEPPKPKPPQAGCGVRNVGGLDFEVAGALNNEAGFGEFPWTVAIIRIDDDVCICGGSLIHPKAILTGNHCVRDYVAKANDLKIRAGEWDTQTTKERLPYQERILSRIFGHPNYNERSLANDIAIVELEDPFQMDRHISTVCLPPAGFVPNQQECFASGWGKDVFGQAGKYSVIMKRVPLGIVEFTRCQSELQGSRLGDKFRLDTSFICAGGVEGIDTCEGDGGAPLVCPIGRPSDNRYAQNGIVAWGISCKTQLPAVYANVALHRDWIDGQIRFIGLDTSYYSYWN